MYKKGDFLYWTVNVHDEIYERAGEVAFVVPANISPLKYIPEGFNFHGTGVRNTMSFLIKIPGCTTLYWPSIEHLQSLSKDKWHLLYDQKLHRTVKSYRDTNKADRESIRDLCKIMALLFGDQYFENDKFIVVPAWGRRFWFATKYGEEYVKEVENFKPVRTI